MRMTYPLIALLAGLLFVPSIGHAADFHWLHPGAEPYQGTPEQAITALAPKVPAAVRTVLLHMLVTGEGCRETDIPNGFRFDLMLFGKGKKKANVIADTAKWPPNVPRTMLMCTVRHDGREYVLLRPTICKNVSLRIISIQDECIPCEECGPQKKTPTS